MLTLASRSAITCSPPRAPMLTIAASATTHSSVLSLTMCLLRIRMSPFLGVDAGKSGLGWFAWPDRCGCDQRFGVLSKRAMSCITGNAPATTNAGCPPSFPSGPTASQTSFAMSISSAHNPKFSRGMYLNPAWAGAPRKVRGNKVTQEIYANPSRETKACPIFTVYYAS